MSNYTDDLRAALRGDVEALARVEAAEAGYDSIAFPDGLVAAVAAYARAAYVDPAVSAAARESLAEICVGDLSQADYDSLFLVWPRAAEVVTALFRRIESGEQSDRTSDLDVRLGSYVAEHDGVDLAVAR